MGLRRGGIASSLSYEGPISDMLLVRVSPPAAGSGCLVGSETLES